MKTLEELIVDLEKSNDKLRIDNLKMRLELEILAEDTRSVLSRKIIAKYRRLKAQRDERELEMKTDEGSLKYKDTTKRYYHRYR